MAGWENVSFVCYLMADGNNRPAGCLAVSFGMSFRAGMCRGGYRFCRMRLFLQLPTNCSRPQFTECTGCERRRNATAGQRRLLVFQWRWSLRNGTLRCRQNCGEGRLPWRRNRGGVATQAMPIDRWRCGNTFDWTQQSGSAMFENTRTRISTNEYRVYPSQFTSANCRRRASAALLRCSKRPSAATTASFAWFMISSISTNSVST